MSMKTIAVYFHRDGGKLRLRQCQSTCYPFEYNKNANLCSKIELTKNFNQWAQDIKEAHLPEETVMNNRLNEAKRILANPVAIKR